MTVLLKATRTKMKAPRSRNASRHNDTTAGTRVVPREREPENTRKRAWHNWLMEENYL
jgi:hypothetical protein